MRENLERCSKGKGPTRDKVRERSLEKRSRYGGGLSFGTQQRVLNGDKETISFFYPVSRGYGDDRFVETVCSVRPCGGGGCA